MPKPSQSATGCTHHGGPVSILKPQRAKRGYKQSEKLQHGPVLTIVKDGRVLLNSRFRRALEVAGTKALSPQRGVSASATPPELPGREGVPAKSKPPTRKSQGNGTVSPLGDTAPPLRPDERISGRDRGSH